MLLAVYRRSHLLLLALAVFSLVPAVTDSAGMIAAPAGQTSPIPTATPTAQARPPILLTDPVPAPDAAGAKWFAPTGHTLRGSFLDYWNSHGGLAQFGYPITEEFVEPVSSPTPGSPVMAMTVQYFQRNRFEHHPENAGTPNEVLLGRLGQDFHAPDPPATPIAGSRYFQEMGHNLGGAFKRYWDSHGGLAVQGYPITEQLQEKNALDGKQYTVQYFERSRMELHPEDADTEYEVLLGLLGTQLVGQKGYFSGAYPKYGHAADFSWVSGSVIVRIADYHTVPDAGCFVIQYDENDKQAKLQITGNSRAYQDTSMFVVFGRLLRHDEPYSRCDSYPDAHGYVPTKLQPNPAP